MADIQCSTWSLLKKCKKKEEKKRKYTQSSNAGYFLLYGYSTTRNLNWRSFVHIYLSYSLLFYIYKHPDRHEKNVLKYLLRSHEWDF